MRESKIENLIDFQQRLIGLEFENQIIDSNGEPIDFYFMQKIWQDFEKLGWKINKDSILKIISGAEKEFDGQNVNLSSDAAAGNLEVAFPPLKTIEEANDFSKLVYKEIFQVLKNNKVSLIGFGIQPGNMNDLSNLRVRGSLYKVLENLGSSSYYNNGIMTANSAHQAGVSIKLSEAIDITNELTKITGLIIALCANSSIHNWQILPWKEWRILGWDFRFVSDQKGFEKLAGFPDRPFSSLSDFFNYYWSIPYMMLPPTRNTGWVIPDKKLNYLEYFKQSEIPGKDLFGKKVLLKPLPKDLNLAMILMWPHAKPHLVADPEKVTVSDFIKNLENDNLENYLNCKLVNCYIEYRGGAASPIGEELVLPALILGLVNNINDLKNFTKRLSWNQWKELVYLTAVEGINAKVNNIAVVDLLQDLIRISKTGLKNRGMGEERYLDILKQRIESRENPADKAIRVFKKGKKEFLDYIRYP